MQPKPQALQRGRLIIHEENAFHRASLAGRPAMGKRMTKPKATHHYIDIDVPTAETIAGIATNVCRENCTAQGRPLW